MPRSLSPYLALAVIVLVAIVSFGPVQLAYALQTTDWSQASFPVDHFQAYTSPYGPRIHPVTGQVSFHYGQDIAAPAGSNVRSWWSGQVIEIERKSTGCGNAITLQSGSWWHRYCHLQTIRVSQGQTVGTGTILGRVGQTGAATGPHLHLEFYFARQILNPARVLRAMYRATYGTANAKTPAGA